MKLEYTGVQCLIVVKKLKNLKIQFLTILDKELLKLFASVEELEKEDKSVVKILIDAFIIKRKLQKIA